MFAKSQWEISLCPEVVFMCWGRGSCNRFKRGLPRPGCPSEERKSNLYETVPNGGGDVGLDIIPASALTLGNVSMDPTNCQLRRKMPGALAVHGACCQCSDFVAVSWTYRAWRAGSLLSPRWLGPSENQPQCQQWSEKWGQHNQILLSTLHMRRRFKYL